MEVVGARPGYGYALALTVLKWIESLADSKKPQALAKK